MNKLIVSALALGLVATSTMAQGLVLLSTQAKAASIGSTVGDDSGKYTTGDYLNSAFTGFVYMTSEFGLATEIGSAAFTETKTGAGKGALGGSKVTLDGVAGGQNISLFIRAADQEAIDSAFASGYFGTSEVFTYKTGIAGSLNPSDAPAPMNPTPFVVDYHTAVPEPTTIALGVLGLGALALIRRRK